MKGLRCVSAAVTLLALLSTSAPAMAAHSVGPVVKDALAGAPSMMAKVKSCPSVSKEASSVLADCFALGQTLGSAESNLRNAEANLANIIMVYNSCLQWPGWDCSFWESQIDIYYNALVAAEYAYIDALQAWIQGNCFSGLPGDAD